MTIREELRGALTNVLSNASNYPEKMQTRLLGQNMGQLTDKVTDVSLAVLANHPVTGDTSDGHHTFDELYDYRMLYNAHAAHGWLAAGIPVVKSWHHSDGELCFGGGWFIVTASLPTGQVSNHYQAAHWDLFAVPAVDFPPEYDGHTPADAASRLRYAAGYFIVQTPSDEVQDEGDGSESQVEPRGVVGGVETANGGEKVEERFDQVGVGEDALKGQHERPMRVAPTNATSARTRSHAALIEKAENAVLDAWDERAKNPPVTESLASAAVRAAFAVFESAQKPIRCDYCGDALPSLVSRAAGLPTPDLIRRGFDADKVVCPECASRAQKPTDRMKNGPCWDEGFAILRDPVPPRCVLEAGHLGAHQSGTSTWMHLRPVSQKPTVDGHGGRIPWETDEGVVTAVDLDGTVHREKPQTEPTDATVLGAVDAFMNSWSNDPEGLTYLHKHMDAALRAALNTKEEDR